MENREYFRVKDVIPVVARKVHQEEEPGIRSTVIPGSSIYQNAATVSFDDGEANIDSRVLNILAEMNTKLNLILEKSTIESEGFNKAANKKVDLSEGGIRFNVNQKYEVGDLIEVKLLLSRLPLIGLIVYGRVSRVSKIGQEEYEIGVVFLDIEDDVKEMLWRYILDRQRATLRKQVDKDS